MRTQSIQRAILGRSSRITIKVGTNSLIDTTSWQFREEWFQQFIRSVVSLKREFSIVTSGAIGLERCELGGYLPKNLQEKQALAARGQPKLHRRYEVELAKHGLTAGQTLGSRLNFSNLEGLFNARAALQAIRDLGGVAITNENDTFYTEEIRFGDNDRLSAYVAHADLADTLILVTDVNGLYTDNPSTNPDARHIPVVECLDQKTMSLAKGANGNHSSGGMLTKLLAALIASEHKINTIIVNGQDPFCLGRLFDGDFSHATFIPHSAHPQVRFF